MGVDTLPGILPVNLIMLELMKTVRSKALLALYSACLCVDCSKMSDAAAGYTIRSIIRMVHILHKAVRVHDLLKYT